MTLALVSAPAPAASPALAAPAPERTLSAFYHALHQRLGPQHWWPAETPFEVIVGAILTQSTAWTNVERAIANLRNASLLQPAALSRVRLSRLERLVRPSGYYRQKARKLKAFVRFLEREYGGSLERMFREPTDALRARLLAIHGIGPETADSILLYAGNHPIFVMDAYTRRILSRHGLTHPDVEYHEAQAIFHRELPREARLFTEYHALLVETGKRWCLKSKAQCGECPLGRFLEPKQ